METESKATPWWQRGITSVLLVAVIVGAFMIGTRVGGAEGRFLSSLLAAPATPVEEANFDEFWRVWHLMDEKFATASGTEGLTTEEKMQGAIDGLVDAFGDPYTTYMPPAAAAAFGEDISGNFSGVGMEVGMRNNILTVIAPLSGTPAERAGILAGDILYAINGSTTENMSVDEAVRRIRGEEGTVVTITILRASEMAPRDIEITRARIEVPTVKTETRDGVFIISLYSFNALSEQKMKEAIANYARSGANRLIIDVRGNPGGYLQSAVGIASALLPSGKVVLRESFSDERAEEVYRTSGRPLKELGPNEAVVLIDGGSASASEILAGALRAHGVATLVGQSSFGKGSVQEVVDLPSGGSLKVTIARWLTPEGRSISTEGLAPDIVVERTVADREADRDPQLEAAIAVLQGTYVPATTTATSTPR